MTGGRNSYKNLQGSGELENVFTGRYKLNFIPQNVSFPEDELLLLKGSTLSIIPEEYFREKVDSINRSMKSQDDNFFKLNTQAAELENDLHLLGEAGIKYSGTDSIIQTMKQQLQLYGDIKSKRNELSGINEQLSSLKSERENIEPYFKSANFQKNIYPWISIPIGTGFLGLGFYTIIASAIEGYDLEVSTIVIGVGGVGLGITGLVTGIVFGADTFEDPGPSVASEYRSEIIKKGQSLNRWPEIQNEERVLTEKKFIVENELSILENEYNTEYAE